MKPVIGLNQLVDEIHRLVDHKVSDEAEAARFMQALRVYPEGPLRLFV